jgi:hypothetical protein
MLACIMLFCPNSTSGRPLYITLPDGSQNIVISTLVPEINHRQNYFLIVPDNSLF